MATTKTREIVQYFITYDGHLVTPGGVTATTTGLTTAHFTDKGLGVGATNNSFATFSEVGDHSFITVKTVTGLSVGMSGAAVTGSTQMPYITTSTGTTYAGVDPRTEYIVNLATTAGMTILPGEIVYQDISGSSLYSVVTSYVTGGITTPAMNNSDGISYPLMGLRNVGNSLAATAGPTGPSAGITIYTGDGRSWGGSTVSSIHQNIDVTNMAQQLRLESRDLNEGGTLQFTYGSSSITFDMAPGNIRALRVQYDTIRSNLDVWGPTQDETIQSTIVYDTQNIAKTLQTTSGASGGIGGSGAFQEFASKVFKEQYDRDYNYDTIGISLDRVDSVNKLNNIGLTLS